jgi:hypothetical protein
MARRTKKTRKITPKWKRGLALPKGPRVLGQKKEI